MKIIFVLSALLSSIFGHGSFQINHPIVSSISDKSTLGIVDGQDAVRNQFPYQISLQVAYDSGYSHSCGASIISPNWILCAAHCTVFRDPADLRVVAGILLLNDTNIPGQQIRSVREFINHPSYIPDVISPYDISLILLDSPLNFTVNVQPIHIPLQGLVSRGIATVSGWGLLETGGEIPNHLQFADLPIVPEDDCNAIWSRLGPSNPFSKELNICSGTVKGDESVCSSDSGGPLAQNGSVIGVVSWGAGLCGNGDPSVYVKTSAFSNWITNNTNGDVKPDY